MKKLFGLITFITILLHCALTQEIATSLQKFVSYNSESIALINAQVIDGTGGPLKTNQTIIVKSGLITTIGPSDRTAIPEGTEVLNCEGKTITPGFVMLHEHLFYTMPFEGQFNVGQMSYTFPRLYLAGGATTIRTGGSIQPGSDIRIKELINSGQVTGPKIDATGPFINRQSGNLIPLGEIETSREAAEIVNFWADRGATSFKVYQTIFKEDLIKVVEAAHARNLKVTGHLCSVTFREATEIGIDGLEHGFFVSSDFVPDKTENFCDPFERSKSLRELDEDSPKMKELIEFLIAKNVSITSTLPVFEPYTGREAVPGGALEALVPQVRERLLKNYASRVNKDQASLDYFKKQMKWEKQFHDAGGLLVAGTDPTGAGRVVAGYANQHTIELLIEAGYTIEEAIKIATLNGALYLEQDHEIGSIVPGKKADLIIVDGDLKKDVSRIRHIDVVFKDGVGFDSKKLFNSVKGQVGLN